MRSNKSKPVKKQAEACNLSSAIVEVRTTKVFERQAKRLMKKYPSLKKELLSLADELSKNPIAGTPLGHQCYKIRLAISSKGKGQSDGARVITHYFVEGGIVFLLSIYDKSEQVTILDSELKELFAAVEG